jgi:hypothetical protein
MFFIKSRKQNSVMNRYRNSLYYSYTKPSFLGGLARILDLGGTLRNNNSPSGSVYEMDIMAMRSDWIAIGQDIGDAIGAYPDHETSDRLTHERS